MAYIDVPQFIADSFFMANIDLASNKGHQYNGRCPVCGDSDRNSRKKRLYMLHDPAKGYRFYCHNDGCEVNHSFVAFVKEYFPMQWDGMKSDLFKNMGKIMKTRDALISTTSDESSKKDKEEVVEEVEEKVELEDGQTDIKVQYDPELDDFLKRCCVKLSDKDKYKHLTGYINDAIEYLQGRKIPQRIIDGCYICYTNDKVRDWYKYVNRVLIPFYDREGKIYYFQGRTLIDNNVKYINWTPSDKARDKPVYNELFINTNEPVIMCEGLMDSFFARNACSTLGVKFSAEKLEMYHDMFGDNLVWVVDNDKAGKNKMTWLLKKGETCFLIPDKYNKPSKRLGGEIPKDLNDFSIATRTEDLTKFILKNCHKGLKAVLKLNIKEENYVG